MIKFIKNFFKRIAFLWRFSKDPMNYVNTKNSQLWEGKFKAMSGYLKTDLEKKFAELETSFAENMEEEHRARLNAVTEKAKKLIGERTQVHADIDWQNNPHEIIVIGRYKNVDYVRVYHLHADDWKQIVEYLKTLEPYAGVGRMDAPRSIPITAVFGKDGRL